MHMTSRHPGLILSRDLRAFGLDDAELRRACKRGELVCVRRGAYVEAELWARLGVDERYRLTVVAAAAACRSRVVISHVSAAVLYGLPLVGAPPRWVHTLVAVPGGSRREHGFVKHARADYERPVQQTVDGVALTPVETTLVDVCLTEPFLRAVVMTDHALRTGLVTLEKMAAEFASRETARGASRVRAVLEFASPLSAGPLESVSRVGFRLLGVPDPVLQHPLFDPSGRRVAIVDNWWPHAGAVGESDGRIKNTDPAMMNGRSAQDVLIDEKHREDEIRALPEVSGFARWGWSTALDTRRLGEVLARAGVVPVQRARGRSSPANRGVAGRPAPSDTPVCDGSAAGIDGGRRTAERDPAGGASRASGRVAR
jgi:predicted transcriptional regulator of viral defense system